MKKLTSIIPLILFAIILSSSSRVVESCFLSKGHILVVTRNILTDTDPVKVHCFTGDDEFGYHVLNGAQKFVRTFCENVFLPNTQFFCRVWWRGKSQGFRAFDQEIDYTNKMNVWLVREDGIYWSHDFNTMVNKYDWA